MRKAAKLYVLLGVLIAVCAAAFAVSRYQEKKEDIKNSGEVILSIPTDSVTALSWTNESGSFSFTKDESWVYDGDAAFPVDAEKMDALLEQFESFAAAFVIDDVDDYGQYGLDTPVCTITVTAGDESRTIELGDFSKMDEQRYISIGDGKAYLAVHDPLDEFGAVLSDMILNDTVPDFDTAESITLSGGESYTIERDEDGASICADDVYFAGGRPLDTDSVESLLSSVKGLSLTDFVSYNVSDAELAEFGLDEPEQTITVGYTAEAGGKTESGSVSIALSRNVEEAAAYDEAVENGDEELPDVTYYARVGESQIVYRITQTAYDRLTAVSYDELRHQELFTADFGEVTAIDVTLGGEKYEFKYVPAEKDGEDGVWTYLDVEFDVSRLKSALGALTASEFTDEEASGQEEISLTLSLDNDAFPTFTLTLYRYDGSSCVAAVDGKPVALVPRSQAVDIIEAVNELTLGK